MKYLPFIIIVNLVIFVSPVYAEYVLPYPSFMPGNKLYRISRVYDNLMKYWYFGNLAGARYHLSLTDKYLVEAKVLFEYKQYLLATDALKRSDVQSECIMPYVKNAVKRNIDTKKICQLLSDAMDKHKQILDELKNITPAQFFWQPEKDSPADLAIHQLLDRSVIIRQLLLTETGKCQ